MIRIGLLGIRLIRWLGIGRHRVSLRRIRLLRWIRLLRRVRLLRREHRWLSRIRRWWGWRVTRDVRLFLGWRVDDGCGGWSQRLSHVGVDYPARLGSGAAALLAAFAPTPAATGYDGEDDR